jgi:hypothetical protein
MPLPKVRLTAQGLSRTEAVIWASISAGATCAIIAGAIAQFGWLSLDKIFTVGSVVISLISLVIMIVIAQDQTGQIKSLDSLNDELRARRAERERVKALFLASGEEQYTCVLPVEYRKRPLPAIAAGDYYAWHVIQNFADEVRIGMHLTNRARAPKSAPGVPAGNSIFLCSPQVNPLLDELAPWIQLLDGNRIDCSEGAGRGLKALEKIKLPIWFGCRDMPVRKPGGEALEIWPEKLICCISDSNITAPAPEMVVLTSQAEEDYIRAARLEDGQTPAIAPGLKPDMALIVRASRRLFDSSARTGAADKIVVIAGIHQYGTWIAGDFIEKYCRGERPEVNDLFRSEADFAILVYGQFDEKTLTVESSAVHATDAWQFNGNGWDRVAVKRPEYFPL